MSAVEFTARNEIQLFTIQGVRIMAKRKRAKAAKGKGSSDLVVKSKVKEMISKNKCNSSSDVAAGLNMMVAWYIDQACKRAKANKRKTVRAHDIITM
jgi:histone H3/H4